MKFIPIFLTGNNECGGQIVNGLLDANGTPWIVHALSKDNVIDFWIESTEHYVDAVRIQLAHMNPARKMEKYVKFSFTPKDL